MIILEESDLNEEALTSIHDVLFIMLETSVHNNSEIEAEIAIELKISKLESKKKLDKINAKVEKAANMLLKDPDNSKLVLKYGELLVDQEKAYSKFKKDAYWVSIDHQVETVSGYSKTSNIICEGIGSTIVGGAIGASSGALLDIALAQRRFSKLKISKEYNKVLNDLHFAALEYDRSPTKKNKEKYANLMVKEKRLHKEYIYIFVQKYIPI